MHVIRGSLESPAADAEATRRLADHVRGVGEPVVRVWFPPRHVAFGRRDRRAPGYERARTAAADRGYQTTERSTGGRAVAFHGDVFAVVLAEPTEPSTPAVDGRYDRMLGTLQTALADLGVDTERGEPPRSFCPGTRSLQAGGKVVGLAQRVRREVAVIGAVVVVADTAELAAILTPVYDALGVAFDPDSIGSMAAAGAQRTRPIIRKTVEAALIGDADPTVTQVRDT